jgi:hypothetical protein
LFSASRSGIGNSGRFFVLFVVVVVVIFLPFGRIHSDFLFGHDRGRSGRRRHASHALRSDWRLWR